MKTTNSVELSRNTTRLPIDHFRWLKQSIEHGGKYASLQWFYNRGINELVILAAINL